jgi:hypothetical protein
VSGRTSSRYSQRRRHSLEGRNKPRPARLLVISAKALSRGSPGRSADVELGPQLAQTFFEGPAPIGINEKASVLHEVCMRAFGFQRSRLRRVQVELDYPKLFSDKIGKPMGRAQVAIGPIGTALCRCRVR